MPLQIGEVCDLVVVIGYGLITNAAPTHGRNTGMSSFSQEKLKPLPVEPIEMIAIDLDGTLLRKDGNLGTKTVAAVEEASRWR